MEKIFFEKFSFSINHNQRIWVRFSYSLNQSLVQIRLAATVINTQTARYNTDSLIILAESGS